MERVGGVRVLRSYVLEVAFSDGFAREIDVEPLLEGEPFEPLKDFALFSQATVDHEYGTVAWPNGTDLAPEMLYHGDQHPYAAYPADATLDGVVAESTTR